MSELPLPAALPDLRDHPVVALLIRRRVEGSLPGARRDGARVALAIEGGGMRGVIAAAMAAAIEQLGLTQGFDDVYGASAGALTGASLVAGQAAYGCAMFLDDVLLGNRFISMRRGLRGGRLIDMDYVIDEVFTAKRPLDFASVVRSGVRLHCTATDVAAASPVDLTDLRSPADVRAAMLASTRIPRLAGPPVHFRGRRFLDPTLAHSIPVEAAIENGATHVLALQTRPIGVPHRPPSFVGNALIERGLSRLNPRLVDMYRTRSERYEALGKLLACGTRTREPVTPAVCGVRPAPGTAMVGHLQQDRGPLAAAAVAGMRAAWAAFTGEQPDVALELRARPASEPLTTPVLRAA